MAGIGFQDMLPATFTSSDLNKFPKFAELLQALGEKLDKDGTSQGMKRKLEMAEISLKKAREMWLLNKIIYHETSELLADLEVRGQSKDLSIDEQQLRDVFVKALSFSELEDHLTFHTNPSSSSTLFGLTSSHIDRHNPVKQHMSALQQTLMPMLEEKLRKKCEKLHQFYIVEEEESHGSDQLLLAKAQNLPAVIEQRQRLLQQQKEALIKDRVQREKQLWLYYQTLLESLSIMESIIKDFMLSSQSAMDEANVKCLKTQCEALFLKVRVTQLQIKCNLYTAESVQALKKIKSHLDSTIKKTDRDLHATSKSLEGYHAIGPGFKSLVAEFTQIQNEISTKRWGLQKFGKEEGGAAGSEVNMGSRIKGSSHPEGAALRQDGNSASKSSASHGRKVSFEDS